MFCTKCGRKLEEGEICTCQQLKSAPKMQPQVKVETQSVQGEQPEVRKSVELQKNQSASQQTQQPEKQRQAAPQQGKPVQQSVNSTSRIQAISNASHISRMLTISKNSSIHKI